MRTRAEAAAQRIRAAIREERENGVNVTLDVIDGRDGETAQLYTSVHQRGEDGIMRIVDGPFIVEGC
jgi:uncharacterized protein GlcG (DUF336 family)